LPHLGSHSGIHFIVAGDSRVEMVSASNLGSCPKKAIN
jgi:hypothetical protein